jgi:hypothetical protein
MKNENNTLTSGRRLQVTGEKVKKIGGYFQAVDDQMLTTRRTGPKIQSAKSRAGRLFDLPANNDVK